MLLCVHYAEELNSYLFNAYSCGSSLCIALMVAHLSGRQGENNLYTLYLNPFIIKCFFIASFSVSVLFLLTTL